MQHGSSMPSSKRQCHCLVYHGDVPLSCPSQPHCSLPRTPSTAAAVMSGPCVVPGSLPGPSCSVCTLDTSRSTNASCTSSCRGEAAREVGGPWACLRRLRSHTRCAAVPEMLALCCRPLPTAGVLQAIQTMAALTWTSTRLVQMHVWPALRWLEATTARAAFSRSAREGAGDVWRLTQGRTGRNLACLLLLKPRQQSCQAATARPACPPSLPACIWEDNEGRIAAQLQ